MTPEEIARIERYRELGRQAGTDDPDHQQQVMLLMEIQGGRCAACSSEYDLVLDHDHATGLTRGLLCKNCNALEPHNSTGAFDAYRASPPVAGRGWRYQDPLTGQWASPQRRPVDLFEDNAVSYTDL